MLARLLSLALVATPFAVQSASIWVEGENPASSTMNRHPWWYDQVKKEVLSGGDWISNFSDQKEGVAEYNIDAPEAGDYTFWVRANPLGHLAYALDGAAWTDIDLTKDKRGEQNIAIDNKPDLRFIAWVKAGKLTLAKGRHKIGFKIAGAPNNNGALDCFVLTTDPFVPQGTMKPGEGVAGITHEADADPKDAIWIEGETTTRADVTRHPWWLDQVKKEALSGGDWISNWSEKEGTAEYDFSVITPDRYTLWARANPTGGAELSWQLDNGSWTPIDFKDDRGLQNIAADNKPDLRFVAWVKAGAAPLTAGKHTVRFKFGGNTGNHFIGGLDCFVFTRIPFVPAGARKPTVAATSSGPADWFPLLPDDDTFSPESVIDMSKLVPAPAGQFGFVRAAGKDLKFEKAATAQKFWGCGANLEFGRYTREQLTQRARYLRKFGVNIVREHPLSDEVLVDGKIDDKRMDAYDWWFAELKKNGIYTQWSVFYNFTIGPGDGYPADLYAELESAGQRKGTYGIITIDAKLWEIRTRTLLALLTHKNAYTGLRYVDEPSLAIVEMQNEDSVFFWNPLGWLAEGKKMPLHSKMLREMWAEWVKKKYKSDDALKSAWGQLRDGDSVAAKEIKIMGPWELAGAGPRGPFAGEDKRAGDYIEFLATMQRGFYDACEKAMRGAGLKCASITTAWQVGGAASEAANTWTDCAAPVIDRHNYAGGGAGVHGIAEGKVNNESHLASPGSGIFSVGMKQVENRPFSISEWTQSPPNQWKAECAPIMAFYAMGLQGWDISNHFTQSGTRLADGWGGGSYVTDSPHFIGQFPALAFALYHSHIAEAPIVAARRLTLPDLFTGKDPLKQDFTSGGYDIKTIASNGGTPAQAFAIGRVTLDFAGGESQQIALAKYWDENHKIIESATGELTWDYGHQVITVHTPKTEAIIGRTNGQTFKLPAVTATFKTPFVSVIFTPLDDLPLAESRHILITALAQDKQTSARYNADGTALEAVGTAPLLLEPVQAALKFAGAKPAQVRALDHYGVPTGKTVPIAPDGGISIDGTYRAYYYDVTR